MFVIVDQHGKPLTNVKGEVIKKATRAELVRWLEPGERVEVYDPAVHLPGDPRGTAGE